VSGPASEVKNCRVEPIFAAGPHHLKKQIEVGRLHQVRISPMLVAERDVGARTRGAQDDNRDVREVRVALNCFEYLPAVDDGEIQIEENQVWSRCVSMSRPPVQKVKSFFPVAGAPDTYMGVVSFAQRHFK